MKLETDEAKVESILSIMLSVEIKEQDRVKTIKEYTRTIIKELNK